MEWGHEVMYSLGTVVRDRDGRIGMIRAIEGNGDGVHYKIEFPEGIEAIHQDGLTEVSA